MAEDTTQLSTLTAEIVSAYVSNNSIVQGDLATLIQSVHSALGSAGEPAKPAIEDHAVDKAAIRKSMTPDHLVSFIDGKKYKSLKRHIGTHDLSPDEYRTKFGLPKDYPMVAPAYSAQRSALAKELGLGRRAAPEPEPLVAPKTKATRKAKAAQSDDEAFSE